MVKYIDISNWKKQIHVHTGGTRDKFIAISPEDDKKYYFKTSINKGLKNYKYEFWSEIIASELGDLLKFNILHFDVASSEEKIGCLSESIINEEAEEHHDGYRYIVQKYPDFTKTFKKTHSFQRIIGSLKNVGLENLKMDVIEMIIFDAIIGNTDRHSENWALVVKKSKNYVSLESSMEQYNKAPWYKKLIVSIISFCTNQMSFRRLLIEVRRLRTTFSPIYDSGSSLARELSSEKISELMADALKMDNFIKKGKPDIRWNDENLNHIELVKTITIDNNIIVKGILKRIRDLYNKQKLESIVLNIDMNVPDRFSDYKIPYERKCFIIKYIDLRINKILDDHEQVFR